MISYSRSLGIPHPLGSSDLPLRLSVSLPPLSPSDQWPLRHQSLSVVWILLALVKGVDAKGEFRVKGFEFGVKGFEFGVKGFEFGVKGFEFGVKGFGFGVEGLGFVIQGFGFGHKPLGLQIKGFGLGIKCFGCGVKLV